MLPPLRNGIVAECAVGLSGEVKLAIEHYIKSQPGLITLSDAVAHVKNKTRTDLPPRPIADAIAQLAIAKGRSVHFDHRAREATRHVGGSATAPGADH
jgi:hypothetical protein